ncbi:2'-5' RNA ligase family protein [Limnovirga soli]|uniref:2'-5' RNA ligase family protein n=1 Tax=Limnovirga soli TaxID=2656915 RepID=A0A8J8FGE6_9BACT|nr:2'-5' RNA ligase family protein [Limnovirga soli]NNV56197.1 2'-5' RNA ligase family protein [Limnovirga soli]
MISKIRKQLTLFVAASEAQTIEWVRQAYNPNQFKLIKAHVTLCREDEIQQLDQVIANLQALSHPEIVIEFAPVERFDNGKGLFLPALPNNKTFHELRRKVLAGPANNPRKQMPHITLMHPNNSTCTNQIFQEMQSIEFPSKLHFSTISLIEQKDGGKWEIVSDFVFNKNA